MKDGREVQDARLQGRGSAGGSAPRWERVAGDAPVGEKRVWCRRTAGLALAVRCTFVVVVYSVQREQQPSKAHETRESKRAVPHSASTHRNHRSQAAVCRRHFPVLSRP